MSDMRRGLYRFNLYRFCVVYFV